MATPTPHQICFNIPTILLPLYEAAFTHPRVASFAFLGFALFPKLPFQTIGLAIALPVILTIGILGYLAALCYESVFPRGNSTPLGLPDYGGTESTSSRTQSAPAPSGNNGHRRDGHSHSSNASPSLASALAWNQSAATTTPSPNSGSAAPSAQGSDRLSTESAFIWLSMRILFVSLSIYFFRLSKPVDMY